jgi:hypothetical protein
LKCGGWDHSSIFNNLTSLPALPSGLTHLDCRYSTLTNLPALPSGLKMLKCDGNPLTSLPALPSGLDSLECRYNTLTNLPALPSGLTYLNCNNNQLTSLPALPSALAVLWSHNNPNLSCLPNLPNGLTVLGASNTRITCLPNKPAGITWITLPICTDPSKVCNGYAILTGKVYLDANNNNQYDSNEKILPNFILSPQPTNANNSQFLSTSTGYSFWVDSLARGISLVNPYPQAFTVPVSSYSFTPTQGQTLVYNFAVQGNPNYNELESVVAPFVARPGFTSGIVGTVRNVGVTNPTSTVVMRIPTGWVIDSLKPAGGVVRGDSVTWNLTTPFGFFEARQFFVWATLSRTTQLGSTYCVTLSARNQQGIIGARSTKTDCGIVVGSYDPNDKLVKPEQMPPSYNPENELVYTIRFQNTGTYYDENVMILDTISSLLRLETFRLLNKSHNCEVKFKPGRIIEFQFNNIKLPETSRNEPASHGFVQFAMKPVANLPLNTSIGNKGYIYFDFNDPIITNTARTNVSVLGIEVSPEMRLSIAPNPATETCRVEFDTRGKLGTLTLTDALGRTVKSVELQGSGQHDFSVADMPAGLYYLRVNTEGQVLASGKLVVEK